MRKTHNAQRTTHNSKLSFLCIALCVLGFRFDSFAEEVTILFTGQTHGMIYPCNCPVEPDGGVSRRAALISQLRAANRGALLFDSGDFFAGGQQDNYTQSAQLDMQRSGVNLKAMELMGYDALAVGADEFNFGQDFLAAKVKESKLRFLSSNIAFAGSEKIISPYLVKEAQGIKFGIFALTSRWAKNKQGGLKFIEPVAAARKAVGELRAKGAEIVVLLSNLSSQEELDLVKEVSGIDILIGNAHTQGMASETAGAAFIARPNWQARRLSKLTFTRAGKQNGDYKLEELRLSGNVPESPEIKSILPACFSDSNCVRGTGLGVCQDPGSSSAACLFPEPVKVGLTIVMPKDCDYCDPRKVIDFFKKRLPGLEASYLFFPGVEAEKIIRELGINGLPAYLLDNRFSSDPAFSQLQGNFEFKAGYYWLKPEHGGVSYFINRKENPGQADLFLSLYDKNSSALLAGMEAYQPELHFLGLENKGIFEAPRGAGEVEEDLRAVCVKKYYPGLFWNYAQCRTKNINSSWWEKCLGGADTSKIRNCAQSDEGAGLLRENIRLNQELKIILGPVLLLDNQRISAIQGIPKKEDLDKLIGKKKK